MEIWPIVCKSILFTINGHLIEGTMIHNQQYVVIPDGLSVCVFVCMYIFNNEEGAG